MKRTDLAQLWHKKDDQFWMPKAHVRISVKRYGIYPPIDVLLVRATSLTSLITVLLVRFHT